MGNSWAKEGEASRWDGSASYIYKAIYLNGIFRTNIYKNRLNNVNKIRKYDNFKRSHEEAHDRETDQGNIFPTFLLSLTYILVREFWSVYVSLLLA